MSYEEFDLEFDFMQDEFESLFEKYKKRLRAAIAVEMENLISKLPIRQ